MCGLPGLYIAFLLLNIVDVLTTIGILQSGGRELNPIAAWVMRKLGIVRGIITLKAIMFTKLGVCTYLLWDNLEIITWGLVAANIGYVLLILRNVLVYKQLNEA